MIRDTIIKTLEQATATKDIKLDVPPHMEHGDYATSLALTLAKRQNRNPIELAEEIVEKLKANKAVSSMFERIEVAFPGFINFYLSEKYLLDTMGDVLASTKAFGTSKQGSGKTVVIDYSSPNIAKRFSIGHLRSTVIGQCLYNLYAALGYRTIGDNHLGDWGTQFGVLIYMVEANNIDSKSLTISDWEALYVQFHDELERDPDLKDKARDAFARLEQGDPGAKQIWQDAVDTSISEYKKIYQKLGVKIDYAYGESFYEDKMPEAIAEVKKKGLAVESEGALVVEFGKKYKLPSNVLVKSNGTTTYLARDLAVMYFRKKEWSPDLQIFEVGSDQKLYFQQVFALAEMMGIFKLNELKHVAHGMVRLPEGKMSTRRGKTIKLEDVLDGAIEKAKALGAKDSKTADTVGIGAVKYFDLKHAPESDIVFNWDEVLDLKGNSGPYLQYTYARIQSILSKSDKAGAVTDNQKANNDEKSLMRILSHYPETIYDAANFYSPNLLCNYLYKLAQEFNAYYAKHKVVGSSEEEFRLMLTRAIGIVLGNGLNLLGIETLERM